MTGEVVVVDKQWYLDVNRFARRTPWAHTAITDYAQRFLSPVGAGLLVLAALVVLAWWSARRRQPEQMAAVLWSALGGLLALGLNFVLAQVLAQPRPYQILNHVEVLLPRVSGSYALPNGHAAIAGAVFCGLLLARRWRLAALTFLAMALLLFAFVYVGADYPSDVLAGAGFGAAVELVLWPLGAWLLAPLVDALAAGPLGWSLATRPLARASNRPLAVNRESGSRLPNARAMEALRVATEAARHTPGPTAPATAKRPVAGAPGTSVRLRPAEAGPEMHPAQPPQPSP